MRLSYLKLKGFRSYESEQHINFDQDVTLLAGKNNAGKTALLRSLRQLIDPQEGSLNDRSLEIVWRLSLADVKKYIDLDIPQLIPSSEVIQNQGYVNLKVIAVTQGSIGAFPEGISFPDTPAYSLGNFDITSIELANTGMRIVPTLNLRNGGRMFWWDRAPLSHDTSTATTVAPLYNLFRQLLESFYYFLPRRATGPVPFQSPTITLEPDGSNLTSVIASMRNNSRFEEQYEELEQFIKDAFPEVKRVRVQMEPGSNPPLTTIYLHYGQTGGRAVPLQFCGTGIEQAMMIATAILIASGETCFLVDEPSPFLHPDAERAMVRFLRKHNEHQYILATHSPTILNAYPISNVRLITMEDEGSYIKDETSVAEILETVGFTAADLWSADSVLWVEGASDVAVIESLINRDEDLVPVSVKPMPDAVRNASKSQKKARAALDFCKTVGEAITPVKVNMAFLFDSDEKSDGLKQEIREATKNQAYFLPVRELENFFLDAEIIQNRLAELCGDLNLEIPTEAAVKAELEKMFASKDDLELYPGGVESAEED